MKTICLYELGIIIMVWCACHRHTNYKNNAKLVWTELIHNRPVSALESYYFVSGVWKRCQDIWNHCKADSVLFFKTSSFYIFHQITKVDYNGY